MTDIGGKDPLRNMQSFLVDEDSLRDLQSHNNVFLMKIILTKETKESFQQFDDIFQFFKLSELNHEEKREHPNNDIKYRWEYLSAALMCINPMQQTVVVFALIERKIIGSVTIIQ
jgi:hypothetical protein